MKAHKKLIHTLVLLGDGFGDLNKNMSLFYPCYYHEYSELRKYNKFLLNIVKFNPKKKAFFVSSPIGACNES